MTATVHFFFVHLVGVSENFAFMKAKKLYPYWKWYRKKAKNTTQSSNGKRHCGDGSLYLQIKYQIKYHKLNVIFEGIFFE